MCEEGSPNNIVETCDERVRACPTTFPHLAPLKIAWDVVPGTHRETGNTCEAADAGNSDCAENNELEES